MEQCFVADAYDDIRNEQIKYIRYVFNLGLMGQDWIAIIYLGNRLGVRNRSNWVHLSQCGSYALTLSMSPVRIQVQVQVQHVADPIVTHIVWSLKTLKVPKLAQIDWFVFHYCTVYGFPLHEQWIFLLLFHLHRVWCWPSYLGTQHQDPSRLHISFDFKYPCGHASKASQYSLNEAPPHSISILKIGKWSNGAETVLNGYHSNPMIFGPQF